MKTTVGSLLTTMVVAGLAVVVPPTPAAAQRFELTPTLGYRFGGQIDVLGGDYEVEVDESATWGLRMDIPLSRSFQVELLWSRQDSSIVPSGRAFQGQPLFDVTLDYFHGGLLWQWSGPGQVEPFVVATAGLARFSPDQPLLDDADRFSASLGAGAKVFFTDNLGLRFEARGFWADVDSGRDRYDCHNGCYNWDSGFSQIEGSAGVILAF